MFSSQNSQASSDVNYIDDVFSTWLYKGNDATQTVTNGINLAGKGGLVWIKNRGALANHRLYSTGLTSNTYNLVSNTTDAQADTGEPLAFASNGWSITGSGNVSNNAAFSYTSWTFREQPKFFDVVTYTGTGVARTVSHNLGSAPGSMIIKRTDASGNAWYVYHRSLGATQVIFLNQTDAATTVTSPWNDTEPTSTEFTVGANNNNNASGGTFVAYLFAHNAGGFGLTGTDNVISCGSLNCITSTDVSVTLGYEPQFVLWKRAIGGTGNWNLADTTRGNSYTSWQKLFANTTAAEVVDTAYMCKPTATGFIADQSFGLATGNTVIYIAIRRPMKVPTLGTSVFSVNTTTADNAITSTLQQSDMGLFRDRTTVTNWFVADRLRGFTRAYYTPTLYTNLTNAEATPTTGDTLTAFGPTTTGVTNGVLYAGGAGVAANYPLVYAFKRAPGFFDEVCWTGDGTQNRAIAHNLNVAPELIITKTRNSGSFSWFTYTAITGLGGSLFVNNTSELNTGAGALAWGSTAFNSSNFYISGPTAGYSGINGSGTTYVGYLFATCPGVSKVGSYTGTGALQTVACGFTSGARFVLIKRTDSTGDWYIWDSTRGISSGTDPYLLLNSTAAEVTANNYVDTDSTGFKVTAAAPAALNASGGTYIFLAIA